MYKDHTCMDSHPEFEVSFALDFSSYVPLLVWLVDELPVLPSVDPSKMSVCGSSVWFSFSIDSTGIAKLSSLEDDISTRLILRYLVTIAE